MICLVLMKIKFMNTYDFSNDPRSVAGLPLLSRMLRHNQLKLLSLLMMLSRRWLIVGTVH